MDDPNRIPELEARIISLETSLDIATQRLSELMAQLAAQVADLGQRVESLESKQTRKPKG